MESNKKPMKKSLVATIIFVIIVIILTFFSKTLYNLNLPSVSYASPTYGALKHTLTCQTIVSAKKDYSLYAPSAQKVLEVLVNEGDYVQKDQELIRLDVSDLQNHLLQLELEKQRAIDRKGEFSEKAYQLSMEILDRKIAVLQPKIDRLLKKRRDAYDLQNEMLQLELEKQQLIDSKATFSEKTYQLSMEILEKEIDARQVEIDGSIITAPADGYVTALPIHVGMTVNTVEPLITVGTVESGLQVTLNVTQKQATWFAKDDKVSVYIPILSKTFDGSVGQVKAAQDGNMTMLADIRDPSAEIQPGQFAEVSFTKMSGDYLTLVPIGALHTEGNRDYIFKIETVQGPLGDEYRLYKIYVRVLDQDDTNAALDTELYPSDRIVTESDQELFGGRVKIAED